MPTIPQLTLNIAEASGPEQVVPALKILLLLTILTIAPAILISMTAFTRIVIVLSFVRQAIGAQNVPPTQVVMALSFLLTCVVMAPVAKRVDERAFEPYTQKTMNEMQAFGETANIMRDFLVPQTREADLRLFYDLSHEQLPKTRKDVAMHLLVPAFMISELRTSFEMGFLIFLPFVLIDLVVASILTAMGMVMLPPTMLALPLKLLLFVVVDGWSLLTRSIVGSFG
jgi:flagellar biosynthesis protein FliP